MTKSNDQNRIQNRRHKDALAIIKRIAIQAGYLTSFNDGEGLDAFVSHVKDGSISFDVKGKRRPPRPVNPFKKNRLLLGLTQSKLSDLAGVSRSTVALIERGEGSTDARTAVEIALIEYKEGLRS